ncbi:MAG: hypothetical protein PVH73_07540 [Candidatus Bathyarchaeota archaeon]|jgi:hypothetical protein
MKAVKQQTETEFSESAVKAYLIGLGSGTLEFIDDTIKFHVEKGRLRKRKKLVREIPMADIEGMDLVGKEISITWKGTTDIFVIEETESAETIFKRIPKPFREQKQVFEDKEVAKQKRHEISRTVSITIDIADSLFDILRSLHGWVDWDRVEGFLKSSEKNAAKLTDQKMKTIELDFTKLSLAIKEHFPEETSKEAYNLLKSLHGYFDGLDSENEFLKEIHPNYYDAKATIQAHYLLNDIVLGTLVEDEEIGKEHNELLITLEALSKGTGLKINIDAIKNVIAKLGVDKEKEKVVKESRAVFRKQLEDLTKT